MRGNPYFPPHGIAMRRAGNGGNSGNTAIIMPKWFDRLQRIDIKLGLVHVKSSSSQVAIF